MQRTRGFTLIELMVVIAIVAILSAIAVSAYKGSIVRSQFSEAFTITDGVKPDIMRYYHENGVCPAAGMGDIAQPTSYAGKYVASVTVASVADGCTITALFRSNTITPPLRGKKVVLAADMGQAGSGQWQCTSDAPVKYVPDTCR